MPLTYAEIQQSDMVSPGYEENKRIIYGEGERKQEYMTKKKTDIESAVKAS